MLRFFGAIFVAATLLLSCTVGGYQAQTGTVSVHECANLHCPYTSEVLADTYYIGVEENGWVHLMDNHHAVPAYELELKFMGFKLFEMSWLHWLLLAWVIYIGATSTQYRMRYDILDVRFKMTQDELSDKLVELAKYKGEKEF